MGRARERALAAARARPRGRGGSAGASRWELGTVNHEGAAAVAALGEYLQAIAGGGGGVGPAAGSAPLDRQTVLRAYERMAAAEEAPAALLLSYLASRPHARVLGLPTTAGRVPTISVVHGKLPSRFVYEKCLAAKVICRHGSFLAPRLLRALGVEDLEDGALRFSLVHYNTVCDVERLIGVLESLDF